MWYENHEGKLTIFQSQETQHNWEKLITGKSSQERKE